MAVGLGGCGRQRATSRLDPLPELSIVWETPPPSDMTGTVQGGGAPTPPPPVSRPARPRNQTPEPAPQVETAPTGEQDVEQAEVEEEPLETDAEITREPVPEPEEVELDEIDRRDAQRVAELEGENAALRQEIEALRARQEQLASEVVRLGADMQTLSLGMISDTYGLDPTELQILLEANNRLNPSTNVAPSPPDGSSFSSQSRSFGAVPRPTVPRPVVPTPAPPTISGPNIGFGSGFGSTAPSPPISVPSPTAPSARQFGAPPTIAPNPAR